MVCSTTITTTTTTSTLVLPIARHPHRLTSMCNALDRRCSETKSVDVENRNFPNHLHTVRVHVLRSPDSDIFSHELQQMWEIRRNVQETIFIFANFRFFRNKIAVCSMSELSLTLDIYKMVHNQRDSRRTDSVVPRKHRETTAVCHVPTNSQKIHHVSVVLLCSTDDRTDNTGERANEANARERKIYKFTEL